MGDRSRRKSLVLLKELVLPDRIELSTSPLPMECSTTELRQRAPDTRIGQKASTRRADPCHKARGRASVGNGLRERFPARQVPVRVKKTRHGAPSRLQLAQ